MTGNMNTSRKLLNAAGNTLETSHILAYAKGWKQTERWLDGEYFAYADGRKLWRQLGELGTLWIVIADPTDIRYPYHLAFCLEKCTLMKTKSVFGEYGVYGSQELSRHYAKNDATALLMSLRFKSNKPFPNVASIPRRFHSARTLCDQDVIFLKQFTKEVDRWSIFVCYNRDDDLEVKQLYDVLEDSGYATFRDQETIPWGADWWTYARSAIERCGVFLLVIGPNTHRKTWVKREVHHAMINERVIVPVQLEKGFIELWREEFPEILRLQAPSWDELLKDPTRVSKRWLQPRRS
jgi:hypothetical protein